MKLDIIARDGSPLGVTLHTVNGSDPAQIGVGGAELAILTLCEGWAKAGHDVRFYNSPRMPSDSEFAQLPVDSFNPAEDRDVLIVFRSPNPKAIGAKGKKIWFSTDQYTIDSFAAFAPQVDKIVTISGFHQNYFSHTYNINNAITIDLPVRVEEYKQDIKKESARCLFSSVPDRGLMPLIEMWPEILVRVSTATLVVTSDYRLWGCGSALNEQYVARLIGMPNVQMVGAVNRERLVQEQLKAQVLLYPCLYDELFCISVAEAQVAGAWPITTSRGAIETTNMGTQIPGDVNDPQWREKFIRTFTEIINSPDLAQKQQEIRAKAMERFSVDRIMKEWETKIFNG